jgi:hypothetical protein
LRSPEFLRAMHDQLRTLVRTSPGASADEPTGGHRPPEPSHTGDDMTALLERMLAAEDAILSRLGALECQLDAIGRQLAALTPADASRRPPTVRH